MDTVSDSLLNEESKQKERDIPYHFEANVVDRRDRSETRGKNESHGRGKSKEKGHSRVSYYYCGKPGHIRSECRFLKRD